jgi:hypothetical protein
MGWFDLKYFKITYDKRLDKIEEALKKSFVEPIDLIPDIEEINGF